MIVFSIIFLVFQTAACFVKPRLFFIGYLIYHTSFFGFLNKEILIDNADIGLFYQSFLMLIFVALHSKEFGSISKDLKWLILALSTLYLWGIINPLLFTNSSLLNAVTASKEFSVFVLLPYLICSKIKLDLIEKTVSYISYYLLAILVIYALVGWCPEYYQKASGGIEIYYPTFVSFFLFLKAGQLKTPNDRLVFLLLLAIWVFGMLAEGHKAILIITVFFTLIIAFTPSLKLFIKNIRTILISLILLGVLLEITVGLSNLYILFTSSNELLSRAIYNGPRLEKIWENPVLGLGFVHKNVLTLSDISIYMESLSVIDSGYIDLLGKFGFLGSLVLVAFLFYFFLKFKGNNYAFPGKLFFIQYLILCITWSVFSFGFGIIPLVLLIYMNYRKKIFSTHKTELEKPIANQ